MLFHFVHIALAFAQVVRHATAENINPPEDSCNIEIAETRYWGESSGSGWCASQIKEGVFVNGIKTWSDFIDKDKQLPGYAYYAGDAGPGVIRGMEISYTDGKTTMIGLQGGKWYQEINWDPEAVKVDWMTGWDFRLKDSAIDRVFADEDMNLNVLKISLSDGQFLTAGINPDPKACDGWSNTMWRDFCSREKPADPRVWIGGSLLGLSGSWGTNYIEKVTAHVLSAKTKNGEVHDVVISPTVDELNAMPADSRGLTQKSLLIGHCVNDIDGNNMSMTFTIGDEKTLTKTKSSTIEISQTWHVGSSFTYEAEYGNPIIGKTKVGFGFDLSWERTRADIKTETDTQSQTIKWGTTVPVAAGKAVRVQAFTVEGKVDVTWKGKMTITMQNGKKFTIPTGGTIKDTIYSDSRWVVDDEDPATARAAVLSGDGNMLDKDGKPVAVQPSSKLLARTFKA